MGRLRLTILYSTRDCVNPALDSEQLSISEQLSSHLNNAIPLLSGSLAGSLLPPFPCDLAKGDNLGIFASTCILSISSSSLKVTWVSLCSLDQQCQTVKCQWAPFSFLEGTRQQRSWIALSCVHCQLTPFGVAFPDHPVESRSLFSPQLFTLSGPLVFSSQNLSSANMISVLAVCCYRNKLPQT